MERTKSTQKLIMLQKKIGKDNSINIRIENLKSQLRIITEDYYKNAYSILCQIIQLRKTQIEDYGLGNLVKERGINLNYNQIRYIFFFKYLSEYVRQKIENKELKTSTALYIVRQDVRFRNPILQNKIVDRVLRGELKVDEISMFREQIASNKTNLPNEVNRADKDLLRIQYYLKEALGTIKSKQNLFSSLKLINSTILQNKKMIEVLTSIKNTGRKVR